MRVFAISDPHLSSVDPKPMDIFGDNWDNHAQRMSEAWKDSINPQDLVLIPGDISWAMKLEDARPDLEFLGALPGKKIILRGNHDYWWSSLSKVRSILPPGMHALQNDCFYIENLCICGSRGWLCPGMQGFGKDDQKIYDREVLRMGLSLGSIKERRELLIAMTHYPPFNERQESSGFTDLYEQHRVDIALYGHLHGRSCKSAFSGELRGVDYQLVSCDHLDFMPRLIAEC